jgi:hypothetical protein
MSIAFQWIRGISTTAVRLPVIALLVAVVSACGSTSMYNSEKTLVYRGDLYKLGQVATITSKVIVDVPGGEGLDGRRLDKDAIRSLLKEHDEFTLTNLILLDDREIVYERVQIGKYSEYTSHAKRFDDAMKQLTKFMADPKKTQLSL